MKKILLGILMMLVSQTTVLAEKDVTITVSSDGATKAEAISNALRSAIEQTYGAFVSSNTTILNDKLVNDEIVSLSRGNIKSYKIIAEETLSSDRYFVILSAVVNMNKLVSYVHGSSEEVEVDFETLDANVRMAEMNMKAERKIMESVIAQIQSTDDLWDYSIRLDEPRMRGNKYLITGIVSVKYNQNTYNAIDLLINMFDAIKLHGRELTMLKSIYDNYHAFDIDEYILEFPYTIGIKLRNSYHNELISRNGRMLGRISPLLFANKISFVIEPFNKQYSYNTGTTSREEEMRRLRRELAKAQGLEYDFDNWRIIQDLRSLYVPKGYKRRYNIGDIALEIEFSFTISKEEAKQVKTIRVRGI